MIIRYSISGYNTKDERVLALHNHVRNFFDTEREANKHLQQIIAANSPERLIETMGKYLKVDKFRIMDNGMAATFIPIYREHNLCQRCMAEISDKKRFCSNSCKYWYNEIVKEFEKAHCMPSKSKRNDNWAYVYCTYGNTMSQRGQGKRVNGTIKGSMAANVKFAIHQWMPLTIDNIKFHFSPKLLDPWVPHRITLGSGKELTKREILKLIGHEEE